MARLDPRFWIRGVYRHQRRTDNIALDLGDQQLLLGMGDHLVQVVTRRDLLGGLNEFRDQRDMERVLFGKNPCQTFQVVYGCGANSHDIGASAPVSLGYNMFTHLCSVCTTEGFSAWTYWLKTLFHSPPYNRPIEVTTVSSGSANRHTKCHL